MDKKQQILIEKLEKTQLNLQWYIEHLTERLTNAPFTDTQLKEIFEKITFINQQIQELKDKTV